MCQKAGRLQTAARNSGVHSACFWHAEHCCGASLGRVLRPSRARIGTSSSSFYGIMVAASEMWGFSYLSEGSCCFLVRSCMALSYYELSIAAPPPHVRQRQPWRPNDDDNLHLYPRHLKAKRLTSLTWCRRYVAAYTQTPPPYHSVIHLLCTHTLTRDT